MAQYNPQHKAPGLCVVFDCGDKAVGTKSFPVNGKTRRFKLCPLHLDNLHAETPKEKILTDDRRKKPRTKAVEIAASDDSELSTLAAEND